MSGPHASPPPPRASIGRWQVLGRIARGSTADVFLARTSTGAPTASGSTGPTDGDRRVVLKRLHPHLAADEDFVRMFVDEARLMSLWRHRGIVAVIDLDEDEDTLFAVLELVDGPSLSAAQRLCKRPLQAPLTAAIGARLAEALAVVHAARHPDTREPLGLVHRDVNPHNVMVGRDGAVKLSDFGVARSIAGRRAGILAARDTGAGVIKGRASFLSPEQLQGGVIDPRSDLFALGATLYTLLAGHQPFAGDSDVELLRAIVDHAPPPLPTASPLDALVMSLLEKDPAQRPQRATDVQAWLQTHADEDAIAGFVVGLGLPSLRS